MLRRLFGGFRPAYLPVLVPYFCYGASTVTAVALLYFEKQTLGLTPAEAAQIAFWLGLPWSMKMVAGVSSDAYPILGSRRGAYLLLGAAVSLAGYLALATVVATKTAYLAVTVAIAVGFMVQDVIADALSVEVALDDEELGQIQTLGRMAVLLGGISVGYLSGVLAAETGTSLTLVAQDGKEHVLLRADVETLASTGLSAMPEGLEKDLKPQDVADLLAYVRSRGGS